MPTRDSIAAYLGGGGQIQLIQLPNPAAGAQWEFTPGLAGAGLWHRILAVRFTLLADANVANRTIRLVFMAGDPDLAIQPSTLGNELFNGQFPLTITANQSTTFSAGPSLDDAGAAGRALLASPGARLWPGITAIGGITRLIRTQGVGFQVGDQYSAINIWLETFQFNT